ncbi:MAG: hypothetical protein MZV63_71220 [Marinilabiliales bacterium]|nr:hypothetical protein [Marinilabiliales bacterium]
MSNGRIPNQLSRFVSLIDQAVPENLIGDPYRLRQVITNLLNNSLTGTTDRGDKAGMPRQAIGREPVHAGIHSDRHREQLHESRDKKTVRRLYNKPEREVRMVRGSEAWTYPCKAAHRADGRRTDGRKPCRQRLLQDMKEA